MFDALRLPRDKSELDVYTKPEADEDPFFCLLEDDSVITKISVETDTLLEPAATPNFVNDARLVITVNIHPIKLTTANMNLA